MAAWLEEEVVIVGAGIAGLATSLSLHRLGTRSVVLESASSLRVTGFALVTWTNAWRALDVLGIGDCLRQKHQLLSGVKVASTVTGNTRAVMSFGGSGHEVRCMQRKLLLEAMEKELPKGTIRYSSDVVSMEEEEESDSDSGCSKVVRLADGTVIRTKVVIGCDGVNSMVAKWLGFDKAAFSGRSAVRGSVTFPQGHGFGTEFQLFVGKGFRAGCIPCDHNTMYWFFTWSPSFSTQDKDNPENLKQFVLTKLHATPPMKKLVEATEAERMMSSPLRYRKPWELLFKDISRANVCVAGDSLHPMTPDLGQGGCAALEDGVVLGRCLAEGLNKKGRNHVEGGLKRYGEERRWRCFGLIATGYLVGWIQQSDCRVVGFLRDRVFPRFLAALLLKKAEYDCGNLAQPA